MNSIFRVAKQSLIIWLYLVINSIQGCAELPNNNMTMERSSLTTTGRPPPKNVKVMIITLFGPEADPWLKNLPIEEEISVPGLSTDYPKIRCTATEICLITTGMGHTNAAASITALVLSEKFDFTYTYFVITGIAGIDPNMGTIGAATWPRYLVDFGLAHEIDAREMPPTWEAGYFGIHAKNPETKPNLAYKTEVFQIDEALMQHALRLSKPVTLEDSEVAQAYRKRYDQSAARASPSVLQCDTAAGDTYWHGEKLGAWAKQWTSLLTDGKGKYCTTQQEDNAVYEGLNRGAAAGRLDIKRTAVLRTAANFDRPHIGQTPYDSLNTKSGGFPLATANLYKAAWPFINDIVSRWNLWRQGVPAQ